MSAPAWKAGALGLSVAKGTIGLGLAADTKLGEPKTDVVKVPTISADGLLAGAAETERVRNRAQSWSELRKWSMASGDAEDGVLVRPPMHAPLFYTATLF